MTRFKNIPPVQVGLFYSIPDTWCRWYRIEKVEYSSQCDAWRITDNEQAEISFSEFYVFKTRDELIADGVNPIRIYEGASR